MQEFRPRKLLDHLAQTDAELAAHATELYETSIDMGAHPNERAITTNMRMAHDGGEISFENVLLADHGPALRTTLRTCAQVGVCALEIFQVVYAERFASAGLTAGLCSLQADLP